MPRGLCTVLVALAVASWLGPVVGAADLNVYGDPLQRCEGPHPDTAGAPPCTFLQLGAHFYSFHHPFQRQIPRAPK